MSMQGSVFLALALLTVVGSAWAIKTRLDNGQKVWKMVVLSASPVALCAALVLAGTHHLAITLTAILGLCALVGAFLGVVLSRHHQIRSIPVFGAILRFAASITSKPNPSPEYLDNEHRHEHDPVGTAFPGISEVVSSGNGMSMGPTRKKWTVTGYSPVLNYDED